MGTNNSKVSSTNCDGFAHVPAELSAAKPSTRRRGGGRFGGTSSPVRMWQGFEKVPPAVSPNA
eukprot:1975464-Prymnesium_polylepis.2